MTTTSVLTTAARWDAAVQEYLHDPVSHFEQPRDIHIVSSVTRNPAGKVLRNGLST
jgi:acyl-CoA synthetase (AMP-forming)/AMP-acid ligase II